MNLRLFLGGLCLTIFAIALELKGGALFGFAPDCALAVLIAIGAFISFGELLLLTAVAVVLLNWQPYVGSELVVFAGLILFAALVRRFVSWQAWFANVLMIGLAATAFHGFWHREAVLRAPITFFQILTADILFGAISFFILSSVFGRPKHDPFYVEK